MVQIANVSFGALVFREKAKEGEEGKIVEIMPGETKAVDIDPKHHDVVARVNAKLIVVGTKAEVEKAVKESAVAPTEKPAA